MEKKHSEKRTLSSAYLPFEEVAHFDHALNTLEKARQTLQMVATGMKPTEELGMKGMKE
jgi:hypothetical protein